MLEYKIRRTGEVTILDLSGRISVGEALAFGPGSGTVLSDVIRDLANSPRFVPVAAALDDFRLTGLAHAAGLAGSAVLAFAIAEAKIAPEAAFAAGALDDLYQLDVWGEDEEARERLNNQRAEFEALGRYFAALVAGK